VHYNVSNILRQKFLETELMLEYNSVFICILLYVLGAGILYSLYSVYVIVITLRLLLNNMHCLCINYKDGHRSCGSSHI